MDQNNPNVWAKKALDQINSFDLEPTPDNFSVFYSYHSNSNPNLKMSLDTLLSSNEKITQSQCTQLFLTHLGLEAENNVIQDTTSKITDEINSVMQTISNATEHSNNYNETLSNFSGELQSQESLEQIKEAVTKVAQETKLMAEQNQRLHAQLSQSTEDLTEMQYSLDEVRKASLKDPLTNIGNRKHFDIEIEKAIIESKENGTPLSALMVDIDFFKKFNDTFGHLIGDEVLKLVAKTLVENLKGRDIIARYGGEEFIILLPQTNIENAERVGNLLRETLATKQIKRRRTNETLGIITVSVGVAQYIEDEETDALINRADEALYEAKETGRNKVVSKEK